MKKWIGGAALAVAVGMVVLVSINAKPRAELGSVQIGEEAPDFTLMAADGSEQSLSDYRGQYVILEWVNHGCPYVKKHYNSKNMTNMQKAMTAKGVAWLSISSSKEGSQGYHTPSEWQKVNEEKGGAATAVLLDSAGDVGRLYGARTTPHMYVINPEGVLIYKGAIDSIPSTDIDDIPKAKSYVVLAVDQAMSGQNVEIASTEPYGCSVKY